MPNLPDDLLNELLETYASENEERILRMTNLLIGIERQDLSEELHQSQIEEFYREIHNLKGASGTVGKTSTMQLCQALEDIYSSVRDHLLELEPAIIKATYDTLTVLEQMAENEDEDRLDWQPVHELLITFVEDEGEDVFFGFSDSFYHDNSETTPEVRIDDIELNPLTVSASVQEPSQQILPDPDKSHGTATQTPKITTQVFAKKQENRSNAEKFEAKPIHNIRINVDRLEELIKKTEELITLEQAATTRQDEIEQIRHLLHFSNNWQKQMSADLQTLRQCSRDKVGLANLPLSAQQSFERIQNNIEIAKDNIDKIDTSTLYLKTLEKEFRQNQMTLIKSVLDEALGTAMLSFDEIFRGYPQLMRKLAQETGKKFSFNIFGEAIEIDRVILESLNDPLVHLLRNAVDHGMEMPEDRKRIGKPDTGVIKLEAQQKDAKTIEVILSDDGKGIDRNVILLKAIQNGLCTPAEGSQMSDSEVYDFIFQSGFSTKEIVTTVSGRGLGMAIVRDTLEKVGGKVFIETELNKGTTFRLLLPVSRTIFKGLHIASNKKQFVIPEENLELVERVQLDDITTTEKYKTILFKGKPIQYLSLKEALNLPASKENNPNPSAQTYQKIVIIRFGTSYLAIQVDEILGIREVVVRAMGSQLINTPFVSGVTVLGNGNIVPVLRVQDFIHTARKQTSTTTQSSTNPLDVTQEIEKKTVLVVDDSPTSRLLIKNIILGAGYEVLTAVDGREALSMAQTEAIDLILTDIEMPRMDGFTLSSTIRTTKGIESLPIVLLTSLSSREDKERGIDSGANAYIAKSEFDNDKLLELLRSLISG